jgi:anti-anti-sigma factor
MPKPSLDVNGSRLQLVGQVTIATVPTLFQQVPNLLAAAALPSNFELDCSAMEAADSAAIGLLVELHRQALALGKTLHITGLRQQLASLIKIYGVEWVLSPEAVVAG